MIQNLWFVEILLFFFILFFYFTINLIYVKEKLITNIKKRLWFSIENYQRYNVFSEAYNLLKISQRFGLELKWTCSAL